MKKLLVVAGVLLFAPLVASANCSQANFVIDGFEVAVGSVSNPTMHMRGKLVNNCSQPAAAQLVIEARASDGSVVQERKFWPAGTANIAPGESVSFDAGRMFRFRESMKTYSVTVVDVRSW